MWAVPENGYSKPVRVCDTCFKFEEQKEEFETRLVHVLIKGCQFKKHAAGPVGMPRVRWIKLTQDRLQLTWHPDGEPAKPDSFIPIGNVTHIEVGQRTKAFQRTGKAGNDALCFSIVANDRTLDLESESIATRDLWIRALQGAIAFLPRVSQEEKQMIRQHAQEQRQREKQVAKIKNKNAHKAEQIRNKYNLNRGSD